MFWRKKKFIFVIEPKKKETRKTRGRFVRIRNIIIIVVGIFIVISSVEYEKHKLKRKQAALDILRLREMAEEYLWVHGKCPENIEALVKSSLGKKKKWMEDILDPWGKKYDFVCPGRKGLNCVDILSAGPDRNYHTPDDVDLN